MSELEDSKGHVDFREIERSDSVTLTWTPEEEKALVRKIDLFLLPTIWLMYLLSYMVSHHAFVR